MKILAIILFLNVVALAQSREIPYTQDDRDRLVRLETKFESLEKRIDNLEKRMETGFSEIRAFMLWGFGILFAGMLSMVGFILWDRKTTMKPLLSDLRELRDENEKIKRLIKEYAPVNEEFMKIAKKLGLF